MKITDEHILKAATESNYGYSTDHKESFIEGVEWMIEQGRISVTDKTFLAMVYGVANHHTLEEFKDYFREELKNYL